MKKLLKNFVYSVVPKKSVASVKMFLNAFSNYAADFKLFYNHSTVFKSNGFNKLESLMIIDYHRLEKGMLFENMKPRFAMASVIRLHGFLADSRIFEALKSSSQVYVAHKVLIKYFELHRNEGIDISEYYQDSQYLEYCRRVGNLGEFKGTFELSKADFYSKNGSSFLEFAHSRKSIRSFTGEKIEHSKIKLAIDLALTSPSVCNRQANKVYLLEEKSTIDSLLKVQGGFTGYSDNVSQLLVLTNNRNYYYTVGERNQLFIDGGIFLMNLLYSLHFYQIANCPANWGKEIKHEAMLKGIIDIPSSEKIICLIPIGISMEQIRFTLSKRRSVQEVLTII